MHFAGTLTLFDIALNTWDRAAVIYPLCAISSVIWNMVHYDRKDSAAIAKAMGGFESNDPALRAMVGAVHARSGLGGEVPRVFVCVEIKFRGASHAIDATPARRRGGSGSSLLDEHLTHWLICAQVASRNGKHAFSPRAKNFDCGGCELALLGLTMCPMRSEPPYDFPQGVTAAIFHQTIKFKTIFWARTNVVKMSFAS